MVGRTAERNGMRKESSTVQIKQIAERLGLSAGTVSIVLNGRGDEMRISKATQKRVLDMAKELHYKPNIYARRLRGAANEKTPYVIALFWTSDYMNEYLGRFVKSLYDTAKEKNITVEIVIRLYDFGRLADEKTHMSSSHYSGIIIGGLADRDIEFLEENEFDIPIVVMNRDTRKHSCVFVDDYETGHKCADLFYARGHKRAGLIQMARKRKAISIRTMGYTEGCREYGIEIRPEWIADARNYDFSSGYSAALQIFEQEEYPTALLVINSVLCGGVLLALRELKRKVPRDVEIVACGDNSLLQYTFPTVTSLRVPIEEIAASTLELLKITLEGNIQMPLSRQHITTLDVRESCGDRNGKRRL